MYGNDSENRSAPTSTTNITHDKSVDKKAKAAANSSSAAHRPAVPKGAVGVAHRRPCTRAVTQVDENPVRRRQYDSCLFGTSEQYEDPTSTRQINPCD